MRTRYIFIGASLALALSANAAPAAGLFGFGQKDQSAQIDPEALQAMANRLDTLESDVVSLTAQVQELTFIVQQLQGQLKAVGIAPAAALPPVASLPGSSPSIVAPTIGPATPGAAQPKAPQVALNQPPPPLLPPATIGSPLAPSLQSPPATVGNGARLGATPSDPSLGGQPLDLSALGKGTTGSIGPAPLAPAAPPSPAPATGTPGPATGVQTAALTPTGNPRSDYDLSYSFITAGKYDLAETSFRNFLSAYPKSDLAADAQYWLGQSLFQRARYADASTVFRTGYSAYPKSPKAPDMLLSLGQSLAGLGQRDEACQIYSAALKQHPTMAPALKQRVLTEQASAACPG